MRLLILLFCSLLFTAPAFAQDKIFNAESFTLDNGMRVVSIPNHRAPVVTHMVWYRVGAADEAPGQSGIAHFVEHLMFKGSENVPPGEFSKRVRALGGNDNAFTAQDYTAYFQSIAVENLETVMTMEADRMKGLLFPEEGILSERNVVVEERRQRTENDPRGYFFEQMRAMLFVNHPYGNPVIGWFHELDILNKEAVQSFYKKWYAPNNALLIVSGDITMKELRPLAEKTYGLLPSRDVPERQWTEVPPLLGKPHLTLHHPTIRQSSLTRLYRMPSYQQNKDDSLALQVLESIMSDGSTSRFYKSLVVEKKLATGIQFSYNASAFSDGTATLSATPADGISLEKLDKTLDDEWRKLLTGGVTAEELRSAKDRMQDAAIFARDSLAGPAMIFGHELITGTTIDDVEYWPQMIESVTAEQIQDVANRFLNPDNRDKKPYVTGYLLPQEEEQGEGETE